jgi:regulator of protease activity HflC (stomatin/prohibitin superfamily)
MGELLLFGIVIVLLYLFSTVNILKEYERGVLFQLGHLIPIAKGPGVVFVFLADIQDGPGKSEDDNT